ncbi:MAG: hypothetical protein IT391_14025 [Nitrospira sp.]|nr:hypothetical protein [Nitrospira sp.]
MHRNRLLSVIGLLFLYGFVMVAAGHGMGQVGLLLVMGWPQVWGVGQLPGWIGIVLLFRALFVEDVAYRSLRGWGATLLGGSLWLFAWLSEIPVLTLTTAIPFHCVWAYALSEWLQQGTGPRRRLLNERPRVVLYAIGLLGLALLVRFPAMLRGIQQISFDDEDWLLHLLPQLSVIAEAALVYAVWTGSHWARWCLVGLALWGWGTIIWYAGAMFLSVTPQSLLMDAKLLVEVTALVLLFIPPGSRWFQTVPDTGVSGPLHAITS